MKGGSTQRTCSPEGRSVAPSATIVVLGDGVNLVEVLRALRGAGLPASAAVSARASVALSRYARALATEADPSAGRGGEAVVRLLLRHAARQPEPPVLLPATDEALLLMSRRRAELADRLRFHLPSPDLLEALVDKVAFSRLLERHAVDAPRTRTAVPGLERPPADVATALPLIVKPCRRDPSWHALVGQQKAVRLDTVAALDELWERLRDYGAPVLLQELVEGPESRVESYHGYVDGRGRVVADFSGRKIRTWPVAHGHTTSLEVNCTADVLAAGRHVMRVLGITGVAKLDFKRDAEGRLHLLEVNPRYHLWHAPGARAGVNLPALAYADLTGSPRPRAELVRDVRWVRLRDRRAAHDIPTLAWWRWALTSDTKAFWWADDPRPLLATTVARMASKGR